MKPVVFGIIAVGFFFGTIGVSIAGGVWQTTGARGTGGGEGGGASAAPIASGAPTTEIKGWMAIGDVSAAWDVPLPEVYAAFGIPADTAATTPLKDLESDVFSVSALRAWLEARGSGPGPGVGESPSP